MRYKVSAQILGFADTKEVEIQEIDDFFSRMIDTQNNNISFILVNPYLLREYSFDVPVDIKNILEIKDDSKLSVHNVLVIQKPLEKSTVNFLAPIIINHDNNRLAQIVLDPKQNPDFGMAERIESFKK
ncbi:flagellar assembly protein FliW [Sulfurimonas sp.]|uniref:flagellar assembly protein FliW n=1 Tax=Sulfurimonas sp. TaxID=2022749 RepID=UPI00262BD036|nr:flagellar assembly protein FliW [Sulfurimonas sp.]